MVRLPSVSYNFFATDIHSNIAPRILPLYVRHNTMGSTLPPINEGRQQTHGRRCGTALCVQYNGTYFTPNTGCPSLKVSNLSISESTYIEPSQVLWITETSQMALPRGSPILHSSRSSLRT